MTRLALALPGLLMFAVFAGCTTSDADGADAWTPTGPNYRDLGFDGETWPDLTGHTVTILDHGAFEFAFGPAKQAFEALTGATVEHVAAADAGSALQLALQDQATGGASFDVLYGIDNVLMGKALEGKIFAPFTPLLSDRIDPAYRFAPAVEGQWAATPVDHGYIAVNVDTRDREPVSEWDDLAAAAAEFVTEDPRFSSPGLGFLIATVDAHGEDGYLDYWQRLFDGGVLVTAGWTEAYVQHFTAGYGHYEEGTPQDKTLVTSYTTSPAYEAFYENEIALAGNISVWTGPGATFHQIQTMGILRGTTEWAAAQAWIEFTLTDAFQTLAAEYNAIYPVVDTPAAAASVEAVYGGRDPAPGTFTPAALDSTQIAAGVDQWVSDWVDLFEAHRA